MITIIDEERGEVVVQHEGTETRHSLSTAEGFAAASKAWLRATWDSKYVYSFAWMGRPIIQLPEDMVRLQEVIWELKPDVLVETGVAHGGSLTAANAEGGGLRVTLRVPSLSTAGLE